VGQLRLQWTRAFNLSDLKAVDLMKACREAINMMMQIIKSMMGFDRKISLHEHDRGPNDTVAYLFYQGWHMGVVRVSHIT
jgi:hypothetical protein